MKEKSIENYLVMKVKQNKGLALKLNSLSMAGLPDRMILLSDGKIFFAELKKPGKSARPLQKSVHRMLENLGFRIYIIDSKKQIDDILNFYL